MLELIDNTVYYAPIRRAPSSLEPSSRAEKNHISFIIFGGVFVEILAENHRVCCKIADAGDVTISEENRSYLWNAKTQRAQIRGRRSQGDPCPNARVAGPGDAPYLIAVRWDPRFRTAITRGPGRVGPQGWARSKGPVQHYERFESWEY